jgi:ABC-type Zn uptake system ZnuABC Zn-binding protein ZnuA
LSTIRNVLVKADPTNIDKYDANYVLVSRLVMNLDEAMKVATATIPANDRNLLTYHDAYAYFARHFEYEVIGAIQPQSFEEPSPKDIASLIDQVKSKKVKAIFGSEVFPSPVLEQIGKETGVRYIDVLRDDDLPGEPGDAEHSWAGLMKFNYITIVEALGGDAAALKAVSIDAKISDNATYLQ